MDGIRRSSPADVQVQVYTLAGDSASKEANVFAQSKKKLASPCRGSKSSILSKTSTTQYEHVPFESFENQIQDLCQLLWRGPTPESPKPFVKRIQRRFTNALGITEPNLPSATSQKPKKFVIERMRGGSYNRVAGITIIGENDMVEARMVLRVPRMGMPPSCHQDITILQFVQEHTGIPAPGVIAHNSTCNNPLNGPYVIHSRIPGHDLESRIQPYPDLSHEQKLAFVEQYARILLAMQGIRHPWAGQIYRTDRGWTKDFAVGPFEIFPEDTSLINLRSQRLPFFKVRPFGIAETAPAEDWTDTSDLQSPLHFFEVQFARWRNLELGLDPSELWHPNTWQRLRTMAEQMDEFGCLDCDSYCLTHYDLDPRNIMVELQSGVPKITGIIDWDLAMFAPDWVSCKPPMWIWNWLDGGSEDESRANEEPPTAEQQELKDLFDELVGFDFRFNAYQPHYRLARQLFQFARYGLRNPEMKDNAEKALEEWKAMYEERQAAWEQREREKPEEGDNARSEQSCDDQMEDTK